MAKNNLPNIDSAVKPHEVAYVKPGETLNPKSLKSNGTAVFLEDDEIPPIAEGYLPRRVDVKLPRKHAAILRDKLRRLEDAGAKLEDGTDVSDRTKAVLWMLENLVDG